jgi:hypothetical protein
LSFLTSFSYFFADINRLRVHCSEIGIPIIPPPVTSI